TLTHRVRLRRLAKVRGIERLVSSAKFSASGRFVGFNTPTALHHHAELSLRELQRFLTAHLRTAIVRAPNALAVRLAAISAEAREHVQLLAGNLKMLAHETGLTKRKRASLFKLKQHVRRSIEKNQNERNCSQVLTCRLSNRYGFSSAIHDVLWCLVRGLQLGRPVVVDSEPWHYAPSGWSSVFLPLSFACPEKPDPESRWPGENSGTLVGPDAQRSSFRSVSRARSAILELPPVLAEHLVLLHGDPYAWWFGQLMAYIMRPSKELLDLVGDAKRSLKFRSPIVGLHIRRTDKEAEASFHQVEEYMEHVEGLLRLDGTLSKTLRAHSFIVTSKFRRFPNYVFLGDKAASETARNPDTRYNPDALKALLKDVSLLSECDLVICTLSSGVCRVVYELMQARRTDASMQVISLDVDYFYAFVQFPPRRVLYEHRALNHKELWLRSGDIVERLGDHSVIGEARRKKMWDGYSVGTLPGTILTGLYPLYKTVPQVRVTKNSTGWGN
ncbi:glycoprotein 6-alpha-L-fucosyltransferase, putative, partial [Ixodes scapularis]